MFKLAVLSVLVAIASAKPSAVVETISAPILKTAIVHEPGHIEVHEPTLAKVGDIVESVPTAVSHQSSTIVHSRANKVTPIVAPAVRSYSAPVVKTYTAPIVESAPLLKATYVAPSSNAIIHAPFLRSLDGALAAYGYAFAHGAPILYSGPLAYASAPFIRTY